MAFLYIPKPDIPTSLGWTHDATDWQIADSPAFKKNDIVAESRADKENLLSIDLDVDLDPTKTYYSRARVICNKGIFEWAKVDVILPEDFVKIAHEYDIPSAVMPPEIKLAYKPEEFPATMFKIKTSPISTTSNAKHKSTSYFIEDINGNPVYTKLEDMDEKVEKLVSEVLLEEGQLYIIKAAQRSTSNDISPFSSRLIYVKPIPQIKLKSKLEHQIVDDGYNLVIDNVKSFKKLYVDMWIVGVGEAKYMYHGESDKLNLTIPEDRFNIEASTDYIMAVEVELEDGTKTGKKFFALRNISK